MSLVILSKILYNTIDVSYKGLTKRFNVIENFFGFDINLLLVKFLDRAWQG